ncbi:MAG: hypothetical protein QXY62_04275 [Candidatus Altiarchaeota archaeon]
MNKKGQGAMEYLMTYGWAILVVLIIGVALWYMGVFNVGTGGVNRASGFSKMKVADPTIQYSDSGNFFKFMIVNGAGTGVENVKANIIGGDHGCGMLLGIVNKTILVEGETTEVIFGIGNSTDPCTKSRGSAYLAQVQINYTQSIMGTVYQRSDTGIISGTVEQ